MRTRHVLYTPSEGQAEVLRPGPTRHHVASRASRPPSRMLSSATGAEDAAPGRANAHGCDRAPIKLYLQNQAAD